jgi:hypothetical protein
MQVETAKQTQATAVEETTLSHAQEIRTWDNWYCPIAREDRQALAGALSGNPEAMDLLRSGADCFVLGYLNAPREYYDGALGPNQHHFNSRLGTALTTDFKHFVPLNHQALSAEAGESSIWSGSFARGSITPEGERQYYFFYTYRDPQSPFGFSQAIGAAITTDFISFRRLPGRIEPDPRWYETDTVIGDTAIHAFRDPFPFTVDGQDYLLISAKSRQLPRGEIGVSSGANGVIAVYRLEQAAGAFRALPTPLCFFGGKPEMEVASLYWDASTEEHVLCYSAHPDSDYLSRAADAQGLPVGTIEESGVYYEARLPNLAELLRSPPEKPVQVQATEVTGVAAHSYANRWVPELGGVALGFDLTSGAPVVSLPQRPALVATAVNF